MLPVLLAVALPVFACATDDGIEGKVAPRRLPATLEVAIAPALAPKLAVYLSAYGGPPWVVAPRGWTCAMSMGADTNMHFSVRPIRKDGREIELTVIPACLGCLLGLACPYFPAAADDLRRDYPESPCAKLPPARQTRPIAPDLVRWQEGRKSGFTLYGGDHAANASCTLGADCDALLDAALASVRAYFRRR